MFASFDKQVMLRLIGKQEGLNLVSCDTRGYASSAVFEAMLNPSHDKEGRDDKVEILVFVAGEFTEKNVREAIILSTFERLTRYKKNRDVSC